MDRLLEKSVDAASICAPPGRRVNEGNKENDDAFHGFGQRR
jgi:hypothetical protein